ncbi:MAG: restriction endonuclease subunit S [Synechococcus sp. SB0678_bin_12]|nr:restriction endonuclease subunit S [Synechococcus sp. SB0678_bin_12]
MSDGLNSQHRAAIIATLAANDRVEKAVLFGSRAMGAHTVTSDVDIALFGQQLTLTDQAKLAAACEELPMAQSVDLVLHSTIDNPALVEHIRSHGVEWYRRGGGSGGSEEGVGAHGEWQVVRLEKLASDEPGSIAIGPFGSRMKSDTYTPFGVPVIRGTNISASRSWKNSWVYVSNDFADSLPNCNAREGDLVFPHRGSIGEVAIVPNDKPRYMISTSLMKFRPDPEKVSPLFLFYYFRSDFGRNEIMKYSSQVGTPGIGQPLTSLRQFQVVVPPREEQERITEILSVLDDKIELNRKTNETLEAMAKALFKSWFVDFDPVRAKAEGRSTGLPDEISALFPDSFEDSELGEIPRGWGVKPLSEIASFLNGLALQKHPATSPEDSLPVIKIAELRNGISAKTDKASRNIPKKYIVTDGDFLFSWSGSLMAQFWTGGEGALNQHLFKVTSDHYPTWFFAGWVRFHLDEFRRIAASKATTMGHIQRSHLQAATASCPPDADLTGLGAVIDPLVKRGILARLESRTLAEIRDVLLPELVSGKLQVQNMECVL